MGRKTLLDLLNTDDLSILDGRWNKVCKILDVLQVQGARIALKINVKKTKSLGLGISEDKRVTKRLIRSAASLTLVVL